MLFGFQKYKLLKELRTFEVVEKERKEFAVIDRISKNMC